MGVGTVRASRGDAVIPVAAIADGIHLEVASGYQAVVFDNREAENSSDFKSIPGREARGL